MNVSSYLNVIVFNWNYLYIFQNEGGLKAGNAGSTAEHTNSQTHGRKSYNRSNTTSHSTNTATIGVCL